MCEPECRNLPKKVFLVVRVRVCLLTAARLCSHWVCHSVRHQTNLEIYFYVLSNLFSVGKFLTVSEAHRSDATRFEVTSTKICRHWLPRDCSIWHWPGADM